MSFLVAIVAGVEDLKVAEWTIAGRVWCKEGFQMAGDYGIVKALERAGSE